MNKFFEAQRKVIFIAWQKRFAQKSLCVGLHVS